MQIVIDIPEEEVNECKRQVDMIKQEGFLIESLNTALKIHVANGTPLPKGHGRLIDADKTISNICGISCGCHLEECGYVVPCFSVRRIESAPTIIEADKEQEQICNPPEQNVIATVADWKDKMLKSFMGRVE